MDLIIGGKSQGKHQAARELFGPVTFSDGGSAPFEALLAAPAIENFHLLIGRLVREGRDVPAFLEELFTKNPRALLLCDEVGCGIVPMDAFEREYREAVGRACCLIAGRADSVTRVFCGIGQKIK